MTKEDTIILKPAPSLEKAALKISHATGVLNGGIMGLFLKPTSKLGRGRWVFRFTSPETGKRRDMGLGYFPTVSVNAAQRLALSARELLDAGRDPMNPLNGTTGLLFKDAARQVYEERAGTWKSLVHARQWWQSLETYIFPLIGHKPITELKPADFARCLLPIWLDKHETAKRTLKRCQNITGWAYAHGYIENDPAAPVNHIMPRVPKAEPRHHAALTAYEAQFLYESLGDSSNQEKGLKFLLLTGTRTAETLGATWEEVDLKAKVWTIPAARMKAGKEHSVPLSNEAISLLVGLKAGAADNGLIFGKLPENSLLKTLKTHYQGATVHGLRSTFRDWLAENRYPRDLAEAALAHTLGKTEGAYNRTQLVEQRRPMMEQWGRLLMNQKQAMNLISVRKWA